MKEAILESYVDEYGPLGREWENPVQRIVVLPQGNGALLHLIEMNSRGEERDDDEDNNGGAGVVGGRAPATLNQAESTSVILEQQLNTQRSVEEKTMDLMNELGRIGLSFSRQFSNIHRAIKRIALQPVLRPRARIQETITITREHQGHNLDGDDEEEAAREIEEPRAQLYRGVKSLYDLWQEYEYGLGGNKAARDFTSKERGKCKFIYSRRKVFWDTVSKLIRAGHTSDSAIDQIYNIYGRSQGVTYILKKLSTDRRNGYHPRLRY